MEYKKLLRTALVVRLGFSLVWSLFGLISNNADLVIADLSLSPLIISPFVGWIMIKRFHGRIRQALIAGLLFCPLSAVVAVLLYIPMALLMALIHGGGIVDASFIMDAVALTLFITIPCGLLATATAWIAKRMR
jgi:hypothetical protein